MVKSQLHTEKMWPSPWQLRKLAWPLHAPLPQKVMRETPQDTRQPAPHGCRLHHRPGMLLLFCKPSSSQEHPPVLVNATSSQKWKKNLMELGGDTPDTTPGPGSVSATEVRKGPALAQAHLKKKTKLKKKCTNRENYLS